MLILHVNLTLIMKELLKLAVYGFAAIAALASCTKDPVPSQNDIETKIPGTWKQAIVNGGECLTNLRSIKTFYADGTEAVSNSKYSEGKGGWMWNNKEQYNYVVEGNHVYETSATSAVAFEATVLKIEDNRIEYIKTNNTEGFTGDRRSEGVLTRVDVDYSTDIVGIWEGVEMTGYETYGDANHRIQYREDGTYVYFNNVEGGWVKSDNRGNEYNVHGDWLAHRWCPEFGADFNYEWWDIDYIKDGVMKWSALREKEDGTRFTTTFTWKKVEETYPERLSGTWEYFNGSTGYMASLQIEELDGGQYGRFELVTPSHNRDFSLEGTFSYDATTGMGYVSSDMMGGYMVYVQASTATDRMIDISVSRILSGERDVFFEGTFSANISD